MFFPSGEVVAILDVPLYVFSFYNDEGVWCWKEFEIVAFFVSIDTCSSPFFPPVFGTVEDNVNAGFFLFLS